MKFDLSGYQNPDGSLATTDEDLGFLGTVADASVFAIGRGIAGAAEGVYDLADWALMDWLPDAEDNFGLGHSKTLAGGLVQGISQFMTGFVPGMWGVGHLGKVVGLTGVGLKAGKIGKAAQAAKAAGKVKTAKAIQYGSGFAKSMTAGAVADFAVFDAQEQRLSNLIEMYPALANPVTEFLAADEDDTEIEGRLKNLMEGGILGALSEPFIIGLRAMRKARKDRAAGKNPDQALDTAWQKEQARKAEATEAVEEAPVRDLEEAPVRETEEAPVRETEEAPVREAEEASPAQSTEATNKAADYEARLEQEHGPDWPTKAKPGQLRHLKRLQNEQAGVPAGARTPAEGAPFNLNRLSEVEEVDRMLDAQVRTGSPEFQEELAKVRSKSYDEVRDDAQAVNEEFRAMGAGGLTRRQLDELDSTGQLEEVIAKQNVLRNYHQQYVRKADELAEKARTGTAEDEVRFLLVQQRAEAVGVLVKRNQEKIAQALGAQRIQGTDMLPDRELIPMEVLDDADPRFIDETLAELGGGDVTKGRNQVQKMVARYTAVRQSQGSGAATKYLQDRARYSEMFVEYWLNSILSGPLTHMVNMTSNTINTLFLPFERFVGHAATLQFGKAADDLKFYVHLASQMQDALSAAASSFKNWGDDLDQIGVIDTKTGYDRAIASGNTPQWVNNTVGNSAVNWIGKALNLPSRFLMAEDAFFKHLNYRATVREGLFAEGAKAGKTGMNLASHVEEGMNRMIVDGQHYSYKTVRLNAERQAADEVAARGISDIGERNAAVRARVKQLMDKNWKAFVDEDTGVNTRGELAKKALQYGRDITYTRDLNDPDRARLVRAAGKYNQLVNDLPLLRMVTPFVRTPTNLLAFYLDRTVGAWADLGKMGYKGSVKQWKKINGETADILAKEGPAKEDLVGRLSTGAMLTFGGVMAVHSGIITGGGPTNPAERRLKEATGWQPYSIRVGDEWFSYRRFDPFASFFGTIADVSEVMAAAPTEEQESLQSLVGAVINAAARNVTNKSYLTGMARVANVLSNPDRYASSYMEQTISSMMPFSSLAGQTIGADDYQQEIRGVLDAMRAKYGLTGESDLEALGITTKVEPRRNIFGEEVERPDVLWPAPIHYSKVKDDVVMDELDMLGHQNAFGPPSRVVNAIDTTQYRNSKGQSFYDRWLELHGRVRIGGRTFRQAMKDLIRSPRYQNLPIEDMQGVESPRINELQKVIRKYRALAKDEALREFPEVKGLYDRNTQLKHYRRTGRDIQPLLDY